MPGAGSMAKASPGRRGRGGSSALLMGPPVRIKPTRNGGHSGHGAPAPRGQLEDGRAGRAERASPKGRYPSGSPRPKGHEEEGGVKARAATGRNASPMLPDEEKTAWPQVGVAADVSARRVTDARPGQR